MTETAKHDDIEDVLSSIRRLVSDGSAADRADEMTNAERLMLTPALRVAEPENPYAHILPNADDETEAADDSADVLADNLADADAETHGLSIPGGRLRSEDEDRGDVLMFRTEAAAVSAEDAPTDLAAEMGGLSFVSSAVELEAEPEDSDPLPDQEDWDSATLVAAALRGSELEDLNTGAEEEFAEAEAEEEEAFDAAPAQDTPFEPEQGDTDWDETESVQAALDIAAVRLARGEELEADPEEELGTVMPVFARSRRREASTLEELQAEVDAETAETDAVEAVEAEEATPIVDEEPQDVVEEAVAEVPEPEEAVEAEPEANDEDVSGLDDAAFDGIDEDMLRELIAEVVRSELQGTLGQRITRNLRKMVRREIRIALAADDFD